MTRKIIIHQEQSPGDVVVLTAAIRDLHASNPGEFITDVRTSYQHLWDHNPLITPLRDDEGEHITAHYPLIHKSGRLPYHYIHGPRKYLAETLNVKIEQGSFGGDIYLSDKERFTPGPVEMRLGKKQPYWVVVNGGKQDFTVKHWHPGRMQQVVERFFDRILFVQTGLSEHNHPKLTGKNVVDLTDCNGRDYLRLIYHAEGVITPISYAMHLAAAVPLRPSDNRRRPCVVIAGGREAAHWETYPGHRFIDRIGALPCCGVDGCWKARVVKLNDGDSNDQHLCENPVESEGRMIPKCMDLISVDDVCSAINSYLSFW
jgi:ADP-heptose:LPS heptosyltransferase